ncbi:hypothetical protein E2C01_071189 [Portunus trituberculatus]|uniref:Uncharacterized protein n=1 Tax=Portunus trituberculatus TaxID=210409 RepID=A0A5B7HWB4_PORTR|nr:hypothetical protein [Portunus trituberculatus]
MNTRAKRGNISGAPLALIHTQMYQPTQNNDAHLFPLITPISHHHHHHHHHHNYHYIQNLVLQVATRIQNDAN